MTQAIKVHDGPYVVKYERDDDVDPNSVVIHGGLVGVDMEGGSKGTLGALDISSIFRLPKITETELLPGATVYWNAIGNPVGGEAGSGAATDSVESPVAGVSVGEGLEDGATVLVRLKQYVAPTVPVVEEEEEEGG